MAGIARLVSLPVRPLPNATELRWPDRDVGDRLDYTYDLTAILADSQDTLAGIPVITSQPGDLVFSAGIANGNAVTWWISGGSLTNPVTDYAISILATTASGRVINRTVYMRTTSLSMPAAYGTALSIVRGDDGVGLQTVTVANGNLVFGLSDGTSSTVAVTDIIGNPLSVGALDIGGAASAPVTSITYTDDGLPVLHFGDAGASGTGTYDVLTLDYGTGKAYAGTLESQIVETGTAIIGTLGIGGLANAPGTSITYTDDGSSVLHFGDAGASGTGTYDVLTLDYGTGKALTGTLESQTVETDTAIIGTLVIGGQSYTSIPSGSGSGSGSGSSSATFTAADGQLFDKQMDDLAAAVRAQTNLTAQRGVFAYNFSFTIGQSRKAAVQGGPVLTTTAMFPNDVLMLTQYPRASVSSSGSSSYGTLVTMGDANFHPALFSGNQSADTTLTTPNKVVNLVGITGVTIQTPGTGSASTIHFPAQAGIDPTPLSGGDQIVITGLPGSDPSSAVNSTPTNIQAFAVNGAPTATQIGCRYAIPATLGPVTCNIYYTATFFYGEDQQLACINEFKAQQLNQRGLSTDPSRRSVIFGAPIAQPVAQQSPPSVIGFTPSPDIYTNRTKASLIGMVAAAANPNNNYGAGSCGFELLRMGFAGDESPSGISTAQYRVQHDNLRQAVVAEMMALTGQTLEPLQLCFAQNGETIVDNPVVTPYKSNRQVKQGIVWGTPATALYPTGITWICSASISNTVTAPQMLAGQDSKVAVADDDGAWLFIGPTESDPAACTQALLELGGLAPYSGFGWNYPGKPKNFYITGPADGPRVTAHGANTSYLWEGTMDAKIWARIILQNQGWLAAHLYQHYTRGSQIMLQFYLPVAPLVLRAPFVGFAPQNVTDGGTWARDKHGLLPAATASVFSRYCGLLDFTASGRAPDASTLELHLGPNDGVHGGVTPWTDSDSWQPINKYPGDNPGNLPFGNFPNPPGAYGTATVQNEQPFPGFNRVCCCAPKVGTAIAY